MYNGLLHAHSGLRWLLLIVLVLAIAKSFIGKSGNKAFQKSDKMVALFTLIFAHTQLLIGLALYFMSPKVSHTAGFMKDSMLRFFAMEHPVGMIIAIVLITMGYSKSKKQTEDTAKFKKIAVFYTIALIIILATIPWPFREALGVQNWF